MIRLNNVRKTYVTGDVSTAALNGISLEIEDGAYISIMGTSGSGKSTLLNILGGMDRLTEGEYFYNDIAVHELKENELHNFRKKNVGFIFQQFALMKHYTVFENVEIPLIALNIPKKKRKEIVMQSLDMVGIADYWKKLPANLSGGQQQRCAIARALVANKNIILADEPTGALDKMTGQEIMKILKKVNQQGKTVIVVTHDENVAQMGDRIIRIEDGRLV